MRVRKLAQLALLLVAAVALAGPSAHATHTSSTNCPISVDVASAANPHVSDMTGDWVGLTGDGNAGLGDLYREGSDLTVGWLSRDANGLHANIQTATLSDLQVNAVFYFLFDYPISVASQTRHFASARIRGYAPVAYTYGYFGALPGTGTPAFITLGTTTGTLTAGTPGQMSIDIPASSVENAPAGEFFTNLEISSRVLVGSPEPLPQPPSPVRHGLVFIADDTLNADVLCDAAL